jgi:hypothetical protein
VLDASLRSWEDQRRATVVEPPDLVGRFTIGVCDGDDDADPLGFTEMTAFENDPVTALSVHEDLLTDASTGCRAECRPMLVLAMMGPAAFRPSFVHLVAAPLADIRWASWTA